jgi:hypothetical protein
VEVSIRADSRLLEQDQQRIVRVIDYLLETAFPGVSGFKHDRQPPHRVEGGACVPLTADQRSEWRLNGRTRVAGNGPLLAHCKELARVLVGALRDLAALQPEEMDGLLSAVGARKEIPMDRDPRRRKNGRARKRSA